MQLATEMSHIYCMPFEWVVALLVVGLLCESQDQSVKCVYAQV